jgi:hypothetical protein
MEHLRGNTVLGLQQAWTLTKKVRDLGNEDSRFLPDFS